MKTILIGWENLDEMWKSLKEKPKSDIKILMAANNEPDLNGEAFIFFRKEKKLYEVNASHCSCNGFEGEWMPEETSVKAIEFRIKWGRLGEKFDKRENFKKKLEEILKKLKEEGYK